MRCERSLTRTDGRDTHVRIVSAGLSDVEMTHNSSVVPAFLPSSLPPFRRCVPSVRTRPSAKLLVSRDD